MRKEDACLDVSEYWEVMTSERTTEGLKYHWSLTSVLVHCLIHSSESCVHKMVFNLWHLLQRISISKMKHTFSEVMLIVVDFMWALSVPGPYYILLTLACPVSVCITFIFSNRYVQHIQMRVSKFEHCIFTEYWIYLDCNKIKTSHKKDYILPHFANYLAAK